MLSGLTIGVVVCLLISYYLYSMFMKCTKLQLTYKLTQRNINIVSLAPALSEVLAAL
jgi:hypothetical protein